MTYSDIVKKLAGHKGQFIRAMFESKIPLLKREGDGFIVKRTTCVVRSGIDYSKLKASEGKAIGPLPWGAWFDMPYGIEHKGAQYVRLFPPTPLQAKAFALVPRVTFMDEGAPITRAVAVELCGSKAEVRERQVDVIAVNCANVISVG